MNAKKINRKKAIVATSVMVVIVSIIVAANVAADPPPSGDNVFAGEVTVTLNATDDWSGVDYTMFCYSYIELGGQVGVSTEWAEYLGPFVVSTLGNYTVNYYSVDLAGNTEETKTTEFSIVGDVTPPETTCTLDGILH